MALTTTQQIQELLENKKHVLITFGTHPTGDAIASAVALLLFLQKQGKKVDVISHQFQLPTAFAFLKAADTIQPHFSHLQRFIITIDVERSGVEELSYDIKDHKLRVFITPKQGFLTRDNVRTAQTDFKYDLIVVIDTPDLQSLGELYDNNTDLFYKTPIIAIDNNPAHERFGQINLIDLTATSCAEIVADLMKKLGEEYIDEEIATALLTGMIAETHSFKNDHVKPHTLVNASWLIGLGANREKVVHNLYRTRTLATLKLWGYALAHMQTNKQFGLTWTSITREDFARSGAKEHDLTDIIDETLSNAPEARLVLVLHEHPEKVNTPEHAVHGILRVEKGYNALALLTPYRAHGNEQEASFIVQGKLLREVEEEIIHHIETTLTISQKK